MTMSYNLITARLKEQRVMGSVGYACGNLSVISSEFEIRVYHRGNRFWKSKLLHTR